MNRERSEMLVFLEPVSKIAASAVVLLYLSGFVVVARYLSSFGVSALSIVQLQYLAAGIWALGPIVALGLLIRAREAYEPELTPDTSKKFNWRRFARGLVFTGVPYGAALATLENLPGFWVGITWLKIAIWYVFFLTLTFLGHSLNESLQANGEQRSKLYTSRAPLFFATSLGAIGLVYVVWFSANIYPLIPFSWGGGQPQTVIFFEGDKPLPQALSADTSSPKRSVPYRLLATTDRSYVVVPLESNQLSIEIARDSVTGLIVLKECSSLRANIFGH
jgi:hypothetical protein